MTLDTIVPNRKRVVALALAVVGMLAVLFAVATASARADFALVPGSFKTTLSNAQAGGHPDLTTEFEIERDAEGTVVGSLRDFQLDLPAGFVGDPTATPKCTMGQVMNPAQSPCPLDTAVGTVTAYIAFPGLPNVIELRSLVYNVEEYADQPAAFGFNTLFNARLDPEVRANGDYGITVRATSVTEAVSVVGVKVTLWGVPADHNGPGPDTDMNTGRSYGGPGSGVRRAFLTNPTTCTGSPQPVTMAARSWQQPATWVSGSTAMDALTGCEALSFEPTVRARPDTTQAGAPSGYEIDLGVPQNESPDSPATAHLKDAKVVLPEGVALSPSVGSGLGACTDAQLGRQSLVAPSCPDTSKIGTLSIDTPLLEAPLTGDVFVGEPLPGNRYRLFLSAYGHGVRLKLEGRVTPDPVTGQLTTTFVDNPQLPFSNLHLDLKGGPRAPLANPTTCGTKTTTGELTSHSGVVASASDSFSVTGCEALDGFAPGWTAGSVSAVAGKASPFAMQVSRGDQDQEIDRIAVDMPEGLLGRISQVDQCSSAAAAAATCGAGSRIGTVTTGAGPGSEPLYLKGSVYLTEGYKGAPFGLSFVVPAIAGPYDLGLVSVRAPIEIDPRTAKLRVVSDPLPRILEGVPLRIRSVAVEIDRPGFMVNPTSCAEKQIAGDITSTGGKSANVTSRYQVGECAALAYSPKLKLALTGKSQRAAGRHPGLKASLTQRAGEASNQTVRATLPNTVALDPANANALCSYEAGLAADCPAGSKIGTATARTPILDTPLRGPVYFVQGVRFDKRTGNRIRTLPTLLVKLGGEVDIHLRAKSSVSGGRLVSTFGQIPDAPVTKFNLRLKAGDGGILAVTGGRNLCATKGQTAAVSARGQNGMRRTFTTRVKTPCATRHKR
jgi:hypothetical protein